ncbi:NAD(P)-dependent oxidoreductase [uncultured Cohaesibacter sp.]|uniref:NAD(P)-dependent oxidoreductase n=1 Tax=uncultured Cohaesibacter sp. TaxID=1002546 RepID=UPI0029C9A0BC|nr:NAD(P)-dependent oxidoreductase [uncultured Cohaesibacter sp.]
MTSRQSEARNPKPALRRERIGDLATLPVFFNLRGKKVVVAGDSDGAAWKAELLAATGAVVHVYSPEPGEEMLQLITGASVSDRALVWHMERWSEDCFKDAELAIGDIAEADEADRFVAAANAAGAVVNIIDTPEYCQFQFGSIVNRSPVVVSISTDGAAPILGQAIRRRIESLIPPRMAEWAQLAQTLRPDVMNCFRAGSERRRFWEAFVDLAFSATSCKKTTTLQDIVGAPTGAANKQTGKVTFIDVWHGQGDLLPMRAIRALHAADIIVYGEGTSTEILELARREARRLSVNESESSLGEDGANASWLLRKLALSGKHVVRLACSADISGEDFQEEQRALLAASIEINLIPTIARPDDTACNHADDSPRNRQLQFG